MKAFLVGFFGTLGLFFVMFYMLGCSNAPVEETVANNGDQIYLNLCLDSYDALAISLQKAQSDLKTCEKRLKSARKHKSSRNNCPIVQNPDAQGEENNSGLEAQIAELQAENDALAAELAEKNALIAALQAQTCPEVEQEDCDSNDNSEEDDGNNGHGNDNDHNDDSNPGNGHNNN